MIQMEKLAGIVGDGNVFTDPAALEAYSGDISFVNRIRPEVIVKPSAAGQIQELVNLANETPTALVPVSSGPPHFRGDTVPGTGGAVVVDLSGMKKIISVDRPRRVAMVEPGVTFGELILAVEKEGIRLNLPLLPRSSKTVVGSLLEREPVIMPKYQWDISDPLACIEVIFGSGDEFRTGQAAGPGTVEQQWSVGGIQKAPYGPGVASWHRIVQGSQGTMGIVTWASMRCELIPAIEDPYFVGSSDLGNLMELATWLVRKRMVNECFILNNTNLAAVMAKDWPKDYGTIRDSLPSWILFFNVVGYKYYPEERISSHLAGITDMTQRLGIEAVKSVGAVSANELLKTVQQPSADPYWKLRCKGASEDVFFLTINDKLEGQIYSMYNQVEKAGYPNSDLGVYIQPIVQGTGVHCEFNLFYDPANPNEVRRIKDLSVSATKALLNRDAFFSRPYGQATNLIMNRDAASVAVLQKLKNMFDPNHIMNPGKVCF